MSETCVVIRALNLLAETKARLGISATSVEMDTPPEFGLRLTKDAGSLSDINELTIEGAKRFSLPFSPVNDAVLLPFYSPFVLNNTVTAIKVEVLADGHFLEFDRMVVRERVEASASWELELLLREGHWIFDAKGKTLCTIDQGTTTFTLANVTDGWTDDAEWDGTNRKHYYPVVDYGGWVDQREPLQNSPDERRDVVLEDLRPWLHLVPTLQDGFCAIGWTLAGAVLETPFWRRALVYLLKADFWKEGKGGVAKMILRNLELADAQVGNHPNPAMKFDAVDYDPGGSASTLGAGLWSSGYKNNLPFAGCFRFTFTGKVKNGYSFEPDLDLAFSIFEVDDDSVATGEVLVDYDVAPKINLLANETRWVRISVDCVLQPGQRAALTPQLEGLSTQVILIKGSTLTVEPCNQTLTRGDTVEVRRMLDCEYTVLDLFKGFLHLVNGRLETDWASRTVTVYTQRTTDVHGVSVPGFVKRDQAAVDITRAVVEGSARLTPQRPNLSRYTRLRFAESTDAYIESLKLVEPPHSRKILNGLDLPNKTDDLFNPFFEPTLEAQPLYLRKVTDANAPIHPYLPRLWDNTDGAISYTLRPRILFNFGYVVQRNPNPTGPTTDLWTAIPWDGLGAIIQMGYATQLRTLELFPGIPVDGSMVFGRKAADLFTTYWLGLTQENRKGQVLEVLWKMQYRDYLNAGALRETYKFTYAGRPVVAPIAQIRDMDCCGKIPTPVKFFLDPVETDCCDLPCGCVFTACDYYQDLGVYIRQETLDDLEIASFKIDGLEIMTDPVGLGLLNIIELAGGPYITNLVDALNTIGAPYFSFDYSTREHPEAGLRYFTIKHPYCQSFEITINGAEGAVYRYTQDAMESQWFTPGTWSPMGYGSEVSDEPVGCADAREYI